MFILFLGGSAATHLQEIMLPVLSKQQCSDVIGNFGRGKVFCWGGNLGESGCFGDSGSPLMYSSGEGLERKYSLAGNVQGGTGPGCGGAGTYGVAWETAKYVDWFLETVGEGVDWCTND